MRTTNWNTVRRNHLRTTTSILIKDADIFTKSGHFVGDVHKSSMRVRGVNIEVEKMGNVYVERGVHVSLLSHRPLTEYEVASCFKEVA